MTDETLDPRFERDLRAVLAASAPADAPPSLYASVASVTLPVVTMLQPQRRGWDRRALAVLAAAAVLAIVAVGIGSGIVRLPGVLPLIGAPTATPSTQTYRLYYEVTPLDRHEPTTDELQRALDVLAARAAAYQGTATGEVLADIPNTVAVDVVVPADDPGRLAELRAVLPIEGGLFIGTVNDGPVEVGASADGRDFEPAFGSGTGLTPTLRPDGSALDLAVEPGVFARFSDWADAHLGDTGVITTSDFVVVALAPITVPPQGGAWAIPFTPDQVAAGIPRKLLALFSSSSLRNPVREVAPRGVQLAPGITPQPEPTAVPTTRLSVEYRLAPDGRDPVAADLVAVTEVLRKRLDALDLATATIDTVDGHIVVTADVAGGEGAISLVRQDLALIGRLDVVPLGDTPAANGERIDLTAFPPLFSGDGIASASLGYDQTGSEAVDLVLAPEATALFADHTEAHVGQYIAIVADGVVLTAPVINSPIPDGEVQISIAADGSGAAQRQALVMLVRSGPLPVPIVEVSTNAAEPAPTPTLEPMPTTLSVAGSVAACPAVAGCVYDLQLRSAGAEWRAALTPDVNGQLTAGAGLPATLEPGDYTVTATARRNPDSIAGGMGDQGPVDATCTANVTVAGGDVVMVVSAAFDAGTCEVIAGVPR